MGWARIDDGFDDHEKVLTLLDLDGGMAAIGLWTLCLSWAHRNTRKKGKTPGLIPATLPRRFAGPDGKECARLLQKVGLWDEVDDGWMIHDFAEYLPDKEVRAARSAAGKKGAAARWGNRQTDGNLPSPDGKSDGNPMADDGSSANSSDRAAAEDAGDIAPDASNGNEPLPDGKLPSVSHPSDSKPVANDGSRAPARRDRVDVRTTVLYPEPSPEPIPPSAGTAPPRAPELEPPITAQQIVAAYVDGATSTGRSTPSRRLRDRVGGDARRLLAEDAADPAALLAAARTMGAAGWHDLDVQLQLDGGARTGDGHPPGAYQPFQNPTSDDEYDEDI